MTRPDFPWFLSKGKDGSWSVLTHQVWHDGSIRAALVATFEVFEEAERVVEMVNQLLVEVDDE